MTASFLLLNVAVMAFILRAVVIVELGMIGGAVTHRANISEEGGLEEKAMISGGELIVFKLKNSPFRVVNGIGTVMAASFFLIFIKS